MSENFKKFVKMHNKLMSFGNNSYLICKEMKLLLSKMNVEEVKKANDIICNDNPETD